MIDVSTFRAGAPCPRCIGRRVLRVSIPTDEWSCTPNAVPFPFQRDHVRDHDATASCDDPAGAFALMMAARNQVINV